MSVILELTIFPMDKGTSVSPYVAKALGIIRESGLSHSFGPMGTCIEGSYREVMEVVEACFRAVGDDSERVYMNMKLDWRKGRTNGIGGKVRSVEQKLDA
ncbi:MTH1187 family thiamine-binding protein [Salidesulfovibrio onnuriiensis]|uniref:MTH1187 family thiamine-binding protein n=1 Tax=Salidesulfovibrio onnuriiensis TaxID=2583823 RepID=UPI0011C7F794|nr:MTH1187 family thiamine-binding protein [Salidesulfovibrio onnuriiensis]